MFVRWYGKHGKIVGNFVRNEFQTLHADETLKWIRTKSKPFWLRTTYLGNRSYNVINTSYYVNASNHRSHNFLSSAAPKSCFSLTMANRLAHKFIITIRNNSTIAEKQQEEISQETKNKFSGSRSLKNSGFERHMTCDNVTWSEFERAVVKKKARDSSHNITTSSQEGFSRADYKNRNKPSEHHKCMEIIKFDGKVNRTWEIPVMSRKIDIFQI